MFMSVDLPDPDGPMMERNSPDSMDKSIPARAGTSIDPVLYTFLRFCIRIRGTFFLVSWLDRCESVSCAHRCQPRAAVNDREFVPTVPFQE